MKLSEVVKMIEAETTPVDQAQTGASMKVLEFPSKNFSVSLFKPEKKLLLSPISGASSPGIRTMINQIKQQGFGVVKVVPKNGTSFEVELEKSENFDAVVNFLKSQLDK